MTQSRLPLLFAAALLLTNVGFGAPIVTVNSNSGDQTVLDNNGVALTGGTAADGDGAVIQIGYYDAATAANNFAGNWVALSGQGSANIGGSIVGSSPAEAYNRTSIGDVTSNSAGGGTFAFQLTFTVGDPGTGNSLPGAISIPLAIRFYNGLTIGSSTFFNVVSNDLWLWKTPAEFPVQPTIDISLDDLGLEWLSIAQGQPANSALRTTIAVPEPSALVFGLLGVGAFLGRRRRAA